MKKFLLIPLFTGCSVNTPLFDSRPAISKVVVEYPPQRIVYYGNINKDSQDFAIKCLKQMQCRKFRDYKFNETTTLNSNIAVKDSREEVTVFDLTQ